MSSSIIRSYFIVEGYSNLPFLEKVLFLITHKNIHLERDGNKSIRIGEMSTNDFTKIASSIETIAHDLDLEHLELVVVPFYDSKLINSVKKTKTGVYFLYDLLLENYNKRELDVNTVTSILKDVPSEILETVKNYIRLNQSLSQTGELMFAHRNTINYRINRFISLTSINVREMQNAVLVYFIITLMELKKANNNV